VQTATELEKMDYSWKAWSGADNNAIILFRRDFYDVLLRASLDGLLSRVREGEAGEAPAEP